MQEKETIAVGGAGIIGSLSAINLAKAGYSVILIEAAHRIMLGTSRIPMHLHSGGFYLNDMDTAKECLRDSIKFRQALPFAIVNHPTAFAVMRLDDNRDLGNGKTQLMMEATFLYKKAKNDSRDIKDIEIPLEEVAVYKQQARDEQINKWEKMKHGFEKLKNEYENLVKENSENKVFGEPNNYYRIYEHSHFEEMKNKAFKLSKDPDYEDKDAWTAQLARISNPEEIVGVIMSSEVGLSMVQAAAGLTSEILRLEAEGKIKLLTETTITNVQANASGGFELRLKLADHIEETLCVDQFVNATGYQAKKLDDAIGEPHEWSVEFKGINLISFEGSDIEEFNHTPGVFFTEGRGVCQFSRFNDKTAGISYAARGATYIDNGRITFKKDDSMSDGEVATKLQSIETHYFASSPVNSTLSHAHTHEILMGCTRFMPKLLESAKPGKYLVGALSAPSSIKDRKNKDIFIDSNGYSSVSIIKLGGAVTAAFHVVNTVETESVRRQLLNNSDKHFSNSNLIDAEVPTKFRLKDINVDGKITNTLLDFLSIFIKAVKYVRDNYLLEPYTEEGIRLSHHGAEPIVDFLYNIIMHRPNHNLIHTLRTIGYLELVRKFLRDRCPEHDKAKYDSIDIPKLSIVMIFAIVGREGETVFSMYPEICTKYREACGHAFYIYAKANLMNYFTAEEIDYYTNILNIMGNPNNKDPTYAALNVAHKLDLARCYSEKNYQSIIAYIREFCDPSTNNLDDDCLQELIIPAIKCIYETGDQLRFTKNVPGVKVSQGYKSQFFWYSYHYLSTLAVIANALKLDNFFHYFAEIIDYKKENLIWEVIPANLKLPSIVSFSQQKLPLNASEYIQLACYQQPLPHASDELLKHFLQSLEKYERLLTRYKPKVVIIGSADPIADFAIAVCACKMQIFSLIYTNNKIQLNGLSDLHLVFINMTKALVKNLSDISKDLPNTLIEFYKKCKTEIKISYQDTWKIRQKDLSVKNKYMIVVETKQELVAMMPVIRKLRQQGEDVILMVTRYKDGAVISVYQSENITTGIELDLISNDQLILEDTIKEVVNIIKAQSPDMLICKGNSILQFAAALASLIYRIPSYHLEPSFQEIKQADSAYETQELVNYFYKNGYRNLIEQMIKVTDVPHLSNYLRLLPNSTKVLKNYHLQQSQFWAKSSVNSPFARLNLDSHENSKINFSYDYLKAKKLKEIPKLILALNLSASSKQLQKALLSSAFNTSSTAFYQKFHFHIIIPLFIDQAYLQSELTDYLRQFNVKIIDKTMRHNALTELVIRVPSESQTDSRVVIFTKRGNAKNSVNIFGNLFGNVDLIQVGAENLNYVVIHCSIKDINLIDKNEFVQIMKYLDHGQMLNLGALGIQILNTFNFKDKTTTKTAYENYLEHFVGYLQNCPNGELMLNTIGMLSQSLHQTMQKEAITQQGKIFVSVKGCLGNVLYTSLLRGHENNIVSMMALGLNVRTSGAFDLDKNQYLLLKYKPVGNSLTNWIDRFGFGKLWLDAALKTYENKEYTQYYTALSNHIRAQYHAIYPFLVFMNLYPSIDIDVKKSDIVVDIFSNFKKMYEHATRNAPELFNNILFEVMKDYILLHAKQDYPHVKNNKYSADMDLLYTIVFTLQPRLRQFWDTAHFNPTLDEITNILRQYKLIDSTADSVYEFYGFLMQGFSYYINVRCLDNCGILPLPSQIQNMEMFIALLPNLAGDLHHVALAEKYNDTQCFKDYVKNLAHFWNLYHPNRNLKVLIKAGMFATDEIGLRDIPCEIYGVSFHVNEEEVVAAIPDLRLDIEFEQKASKEAGFSKRKG